MDADKLAALMEANGACGHDLPAAALRAAIAAVRREALEEAAELADAAEEGPSAGPAIRALIEPASSTEG